MRNFCLPTFLFPPFEQSQMTFISFYSSYLFSYGFKIQDEKKHYDLFKRITTVKNEKKEDFRIIYFFSKKESFYDAAVYRYFFMNGLLRR